MRRTVKRARPEHEHEAARTKVLPINPANARHARRDDSPEYVEAHLVAHVDARAKAEVAVAVAVGEAFFNRHFRFALQRRITPPLAVDELFIRFEL
jgi:hypothetical protein